MLLGGPRYLALGVRPKRIRPVSLKPEVWGAPRARVWPRPGCAVVRVWGSCAKEVGLGLGSGGWNNARVWQLLFKGVPAPVLRGREILAQPMASITFITARALCGVFVALRLYLLGAVG